MFFLNIHQCTCCHSNTMEVNCCCFFFYGLKQVKCHLKMSSAAIILIVFNSIHLHYAGLAKDVSKNLKPLVRFSWQFYFESYCNIFFKMSH